MRLFKLQLLFLSLFFAGCSRLDVALDFAPRYITNNLDDAFDLNSDRYKKMKETIRQDLAKNKSGLVNEITGKIDEALILTAKDDPKPADLKKFNAEVRELQSRAVYAFKDSFSELLLSLSQKELEHVKEYSNEKFEKADKRLLDKEEFYSFSLKSFKKIMDVLFDSTNKEQIEIYKKFLDNNYDFYKDQMTERRAFLKKFEELAPNKPELLNYVLKYYSGDPGVKSAEYLKKQAVLLDNLVQLEMDLWKASTPKQKEEFKKSLSQIKEELQGLLKK